jgi:dTDP-4-dehydrorhamnose reductase
MKILVVGANGQVGSALNKQGGEFGFNIIALDRSQLDISDASNVAASVELLKPDLVINAAAYTAVDKAENDVAAAFLINETGPLNLAKACGKASIPLFHISTDYVFDGALDRPYNEVDPVSPKGIYARSKEAGEQRVREVLTQHIILRTSWVFGVEGKNFVKTVISIGRDRDELNVVADQFGGPTSARSIADILLLLAKKLEGEKKLSWGTYHFSQLPYCSWHEFAEAILNKAFLMGECKAVNVRAIPSSAYPTPVERPKNSRLDSRKLQALLCNNIQQDWAADLKEIIEAT